MNFSLNTFWSGLLAFGNLVAIAVLAVLGHPVPQILQDSLAGILMGHFALSAPSTSSAIVSSAAPRAPPAAPGVGSSAAVAQSDPHPVLASIPTA